MDAAAAGNSGDFMSHPLSARGGFSRPTRASSAKAVTEAASSTSAQPKVVRPPSARLTQPTQASLAAQAQTEHCDSARMRPEAYGLQSDTNRRYGLDTPSSSSRGSGSVSARDTCSSTARGSATARDSARETPRTARETVRGHPVVDNWVPVHPKR
jgi:hypothetical protein